MRYQLLGHSGLRVSELCLGTMTFGETWGWGASEEESRRQFQLFGEAGGNFIDTSVNYTDGTSEEFVGKFVAEAGRENWVIATKYSLTRPDSTNPNSGGNSRKNMRQSVERSLKRLQTDYIDLLYLHMWDYMTPVEEIVRGMDDLVRQGKVLYIAFSDTPAYIVAEANTLAGAHGFSRYIGYQVPYSLHDRTIEWDVLPAAKHWDMAVLPWGILAGGALLGKYRPGNTDPTRFGPDLTLPERTERTIDEIAKIAEETGKSRTQICVNWVRQQQQRAQIIPILGARSAAQLEDNIAALEWELDADQLKRLDEVSAIELGFPHDLLHGNPYIYGATRDLIDSHRI